MLTEPECLNAGGLFTPAADDCDFGDPEEPIGSELAGCGDLDECPLDSITILRSRRNCCRHFGIGVPFIDDTFFRGTVNTAGLANATKVSVTSFDVAENCSGDLMGDGAIKTYECSIPSCTDETKVTVEVLDSNNAVLCCQSFNY